MKNILKYALVITLFIASCKKEKVGYDCKDGTCQQTANGQFTDMESCQASCANQTEKRYNCVSGKCEETENGTYASLSECENKCVDPCGGVTEIIDPRDGQTYKVVAIGSQCWFAENANFGLPQNERTTSEDWVNNSRAWCYYDNNSANGKVYGKLYDWYYAASDVRYAFENGDSLDIVLYDQFGNPYDTILKGDGLYLTQVCPKGWHTPSLAEWDTLDKYLHPRTQGKMKAVSPLWYQPNEGADNSSGFTALPAGYRQFSYSSQNNGWVNFGFIGKSTRWWTSTAANGGEAYWVGVTFNGVNNLPLTNNGRYQNGYSCRCLKD